MVLYCAIHTVICQIKKIKIKGKNKADSCNRLMIQKRYWDTCSYQALAEKEMSKVKKPSPCGGHNSADPRPTLCEECSNRHVDQKGRGDNPSWFAWHRYCPS